MHRNIFKLLGEKGPGALPGPVDSALGRGLAGKGYGATTGESMAHELVPLTLFTNA